MRALRAGDLDLAVIFRCEPGEPAGDPGAPFASTRDDVAMAQPLVAAGLAVAFLPSLELARPYPGGRRPRAAARAARARGLVPAAREPAAAGGAGDGHVPAEIGRAHV